MNKARPTSQHSTRCWPHIADADGCVSTMSGLVVGVATPRSALLPPSAAVTRQLRAGETQKGSLHSKSGGLLSHRPRARARAVVAPRAGLLDSFAGAIMGGKKGKAERAELLRLVDSQNQGIGHTVEDRAAVEEAIDALVSAVVGQCN